MKSYIFSLFLAVLAITVSAVAPQKAVLISYPQDTPDSVLKEAMNAIEEAGGVITHEYSTVRPVSRLHNVADAASQISSKDSQLKHRQRH